MKISHEEFDQTSVISLKGEFVADQAEAFKRLVLERLSAQTRDIVLELSETEFIDSKGLESVLWLQEQCAERLGQVRVAAPHENVKKILELTRLAPRLDCHGDIESAVKSLR
ncbi:MAG: STAS domain-containing protein [Planctomycetota bacterium]|nr:STAS domain-containing protein [Planctomycetota bacterium]